LIQNNYVDATNNVTTMPNCQYKNDANIGDDDVDMKAEAERLRQQREMQHEEEFSELKLAEEELVQVNIIEQV